jgi:hypothetical protein
MNELLLKPMPELERGGDKVTSVPASTGATTVTRRLPRALRRRFSATRWLVEDSSFRPFRIY